MLTAELRRALLAAADRPDEDPLLRPGPQPGSYASSLPFRLEPRDPRAAANALAARLANEPWMDKGTSFAFTPSRRASVNWIRASPRPETLSGETGWP